MARKDSDDDTPKDQPDNSEENFGLPDLEFKPLDEAAEKKPDERSNADSDASVAPTGGSDGSGGSSTYDSFLVDDSKSKAPVILGIVIVLVLAIAGYLIYNFVYKPREIEKAKKEQLAKAEAQRQKEEAERLAREREEEERMKREEALANAKPTIGTMEILSARTRRYYVVVSSAVDDDLVMDYAKKLSARGVSTKMIPPFGGKKFFRLAIADDETFALAQAKAEAAKSDYGKWVWVLRF